MEFRAQVPLIFISVFIFYTLYPVSAFSQSDLKCTVRIDLVKLFEREVGVMQEGDNKGERVEQYLAATGLGPGYPWCAAFLAWGHNEFGIDNPESAWSPAWFPDSATIYTREDGGKEPLPGDVMGIWFSNLERIAHVGVIIEWGDDYVVTVEGNTNDTGSRVGDGVYKKRRMQRQIHSVSRWMDEIFYIESSKRLQHQRRVVNGMD